MKKDYYLGGREDFILKIYKKELNKNSLFFLSLIILLFFLNSNFVFCIGFAIAPAFKNADFVPYFNDSLNIRVYNNIDKVLNVSVSTAGNLKEFAVVDKRELLIRPYSYETINLKISLPERIDFGENLVRVVFSSSENTGTIGGALTLNFDYKIFFNQPEILITKVGFEQKDFIIRIFNNGSEEISGFLELYFFDFEKQIDFLNKTFSLKGRETKILKKELNFSKGEYYFVLKTYYNNTSTTKELRQNFTIGKPEFSISNVVLGNETGSIKSLSFDLGLNWNKPLDVFVEVFIINNSKTISSFKSNPLKIYPGKAESLKMFLDLSGLELEKVLNLKIVVNYQNLFIEKNFSFVKNKRGVYEVGKMNIYYVLIILLVLANLFLLLKLLFFSTNKVKRINNLIKKTESLISQGKLKEAGEYYHKIKNLYDNVLNAKEKKEVYDRIMEVYNRLHHHSHHLQHSHQSKQ
ncbi:MAG: hypothetical protein QXU20_03710 [Candidatus Woesearchaeota archaeon]